jgi:hypothetical protein
MGRSKRRGLVLAHSLPRRRAFLPGLQNGFLRAANSRPKARAPKGSLIDLDPYERTMMTVTRRTNHLAVIAGRYQPLAVAFGTYLADFCIDNLVSAQAVVIEVILDQCLALLPSFGLPYRCRGFPYFLVFGLNNEFPLRPDGYLGHANRLYVISVDNTRYCV